MPKENIKATVAEEKAAAKTEANAVKKDEPKAAAKAEANAAKKDEPKAAGKAKAGAAKKPEAKAEEKSASKAKPAEAVITETVCLQYAGREVELADILAKVEEACKETSTAKDIRVYVKPEENMAYYVVNGDVSGSVAF